MLTHHNLKPPWTIRAQQTQPEENGMSWPRESWWSFLRKTDKPPPSTTCNLFDLKSEKIKYLFQETNLEDKGEAQVVTFCSPDRQARPRPGPRSWERWTWNRSGLWLCCSAVAGPAVWDQRFRGTSPKNTKFSWNSNKLSLREQWEFWWTQMFFPLEN